MNQKFVSFVLLFLSTITSVYAQQRCATVEYQNLSSATGKVFETTEQFEKALAEKLTARKKSLFNKRQQNEPYRIPVVVHIIHNGEALGVGRNLSEAQIISQIEVLNRDFNRLNTDASNTPAEFLSVAGSIEIEFTLAKQDPDGNPTNGITRVHGNRASWPMSREVEFKALSYWPAENYLNLWVLDLQTYLGYAQFPISSGLLGLEDSDNNRLTDGVIVDYTAFGVGSANNDYNLGRTTTHEIGHFLGLRHIWGDDNGCAESDYVDDTPNQADETYGCNLTPGSPVIHPQADDCSSMKMFQNYMDYTDDVCMNLFTKGQVDRMITVLENSPRRKTLLTSMGLEEPTPGTIDLEITAITNPVAIICNYAPELHFNVNNITGEAVNELKVLITVNETTTEKIIPFLSNPLISSADIIVETVNLLTGDNTITVKITRINERSDPQPDNNVLSINTTVLYDCEQFAIYTNSSGQSVITFDLPQTLPVSLSIVNLLGQEVSALQLNNVRNQTIPVPMGNQPHGVYIVRIRMGKKYYTRKVYLQP